MRLAALLAPTVAAVCLFGSALPGAALAAQAQTAGNPLTSDANATFGCESQPGVSFGNYSGYDRLDPSGRPDCTWWNTGGGTVPGDGTVQKVTIKSGPNPAPVRFVVLRTLASSGNGSFCCYFVAETSVAQPAPNSVQSFVVNLPVERNTNPATGVITQDTVGVSAVAGGGTLPIHDYGPPHSGFGTSLTTNASWLYPRMSSASDTGSGRRPAYPDGGAAEGFEVLLQTTFCPAGQTCDGTAPGGGRTVVALDRVAPVVSAPALRPSVFRVGPGAFPVAAAKTSKGAKLTFRLSEPATVKIAIKKPVAGRRSKGKCRKPSRTLRKARRCTRWRTTKTLSRSGQPAGPRSLLFSGRIGRRPLAPGRYRVTITATDAARNRSQAGTATFRIVR